MVRDLFYSETGGEGWDLVEIYSKVSFKVDFGPFMAGEYYDEVFVDLGVGVMEARVNGRVVKSVCLKLAVEE